MSTKSTHNPGYRFIKELKALPFIEKIYLFGSRARGDHAPRSDMDIAVLCPAAGVKDWSMIMDIIEEADTLLGIDCVRLDEVGEELQNKIYAQGKLLYERKS